VRRVKRAGNLDPHDDLPVDDQVRPEIGDDARSEADREHGARLHPKAKLAYTMISAVVV
jgi:hypothetical protein